LPVNIALSIGEGAYTDDIGKKGGGTYTYQACEADTTPSCSNESNEVMDTF